MWRNPVYIGDDIYNLNDVNSTKVPNTGPIWDKIEADFEAAASVLPATQADKGRPTKILDPTITACFPLISIL